VHVSSRPATRASRAGGGIVAALPRVPVALTDLITLDGIDTPDPDALAGELEGVAVDNAGRLCERHVRGDEQDKGEPARP
jgi:hypothetical protein